MQQIPDVANSYKRDLNLQPGYMRTKMTQHSCSQVNRIAKFLLAEDKSRERESKSQEMFAGGFA